MVRRFAKLGAATAIGIAVAAALLVVVRDVHWGAAQRGPNIVLIQVDTLRADHVGCYGYQRLTTPHLDRFARSGVQFRNAYSVTSWTLPALVSVFTGLLPSRHGVTAIGHLLPDTTPTLAHILRDRGYATGAISANFAFVRPSDSFPKPPLHIGQGFDTFQVLQTLASPEDREAEKVMGRYIRTVGAATVTKKMAEEVRRNRVPFFLFALYIDPHYGYVPPRKYAALFEPTPSDGRVSGLMRDVGQLIQPLAPEDLGHLVNLYDGEVRNVDEQIGNFLTMLDESGEGPRTIVVIFSDHGEEFGEHGRMLHGQDLYQECMRVPLLIRGPGIPRGVVVEQPVSIMDIMPTLIELAGATTPQGIDGRSLVQAWQDPHRVVPRTLMFELDNELQLLNGPRRHLRGVSRDKWTLLTSLDGSTELYDAGLDPKETHDVSADHPDVVARLRAALTQPEGAAATPRPGATLRDAEKERLRALGYVRD
jgi:arylsulfatase A-like enzyme